MMNYHKLNPKIFISHASSDLWVAKQLAKSVRECGAETFLDAENIDHGDEFDEVIIDEADSSSEMLVLFTPIANERKYVWLEIGMFLSARKRIVAVLYRVSKSEIANDENTPTVLKKIDSVDLNDVESYFEQLSNRVKTWKKENGGE
jgi:hypothetical protein